MSDIVAALADQWGASEALVQRSADARAAALGSTAEAVLSSWSGGAPPPVAADPEPPAPAEVEEPAEPTTPAPAPVEETEPAEIEAEPEQDPESDQDPEAALLPAEAMAVSATDAVVVPEPAPTGSLGALVMGALVLLAVMFVAAVIAPAFGPATDTLDAIDPIDLSGAAADGQSVYLAEGCAYCHTQQVRPIVTDADLGVVTLASSELIPGIERIGPDLTHVGSRDLGAAWLTGFLEDPEAFRAGSSHESFAYLASNDLDDLVAYLMESR